MATLQIPVKLQWTGAGSPGVNVWHARSDGSGGASEAINMLTAFYQDVLSLYSSDTLLILGEDVIDIGEDPPRYVEATRTELVGTGGSTKEAYALQICVTWRTEVATRRGRGRTFLGPLAQGAVGGDGTMNGADRTLVADAAADLVSASQSALNGAIGVWSERDQVIRDITGYTVGDQMSVLRSRRD